MCLLVLSIPSPAQTVFSHGWSIWCEYGQNNLQQTSDGGYILCTDAVPEMDTVNNLAWCYLLKLDPMGNQQWAVQFAKSTYFMKASDGNSVVQTSDGGYAVATVMYTSTPSQSSSHTAIFVVKTNSLGGLLWSKTYPGVGNSSSSCISETANHDLIIAGNTIDTTAFAQYGYLLRIDSTGNVIWGNYYVQPSSSAYGLFYTASETSDSGLIVAGTTGIQGITMKTDAAGNVLWANQPNTAMGGIDNDVMETGDGFFVSCGVSFGSPGNACINKFDSAGNFVWGFSYPRLSSSTSASDYAYSVEESGTGYSIATASGSSGYGRAGLLHVDTAGQPIWAKQYKDSYIFYPIDLEHTSDNGYAMCVSNYNIASSNWNDWKVAVLKVDSLGKAACHDSVIVDSAYTLATPMPISITVVSAAPVVPIPTVLHYVLIPDTNYCFAPDAVVETRPEAGTGIFPNPAHSQFQVELTGLTGNQVTVSLYNSPGQEVCSRYAENASGTWTNTFETGGLAAGIYFVRMEVDGELLKSEKVVIE